MATIVMNTLDEVKSAERTFGLSVLPQELWVPSYGLPGVPFFQLRRSNLLESLNWISEDETTHFRGSRALSVHLNVKFSGIFLEFPTKSRHGVKLYSACSYAAGDTYPSDECLRRVL